MSKGSYYSLFQQCFLNLCNSPVVRGRTGDRYVPGLNPALPFAICLFFFLGLFDKEAE